MRHLTFNNVIVSLAAAWCLAFYGPLFVDHWRVIFAVVYLVIAIPFLVFYVIMAISAAIEVFGR